MNCFSTFLATGHSSSPFGSSTASNRTSPDHLSMVEDRAPNLAPGQPINTGNHQFITIIKDQLISIDKGHPIIQSVYVCIQIVTDELVVRSAIVGYISRL